MKNLIIIVACLISTHLIGQSKIKTTDHSAFNSLLQKYVTSAGKVDYKGLKKDKEKLNAYTDSLAKQIPTTKWSKDASLAYWINAYNAFTLKLIVDNYPVKTITSLYKGKPWDEKWITLEGKKYSLNNIENDIIRPKYKEPRIHFAVNCAAVSCPPLANTAFTEKNLTTLLETRTKSFLNSSANNVTSSSVVVSKIFDWYKVDFSNLITFINKYSKTKAASTAVVTYKEYDWNLNEK
jgi:hypothetical protein